MRCHGNTPTPLPFPLVIRSPPNRPSARVVKTRLGLKMAPFPIHLLLLEMELLLQFARFRKKRTPGADDRSSRHKQCGNQVNSHTARRGKGTGRARFAVAERGPVEIVGSTANQSENGQVSTSREEMAVFSVRSRHLVASGGAARAAFRVIRRGSRFVSWENSTLRNF